MTNPETPPTFWHDNQDALEELVWTIEASQGQFSLILARCNYVGLRSHLIQQLQTMCPVTIKVLTIQTTTQTLYTRIREEICNDDPGALFIIGLETVEDIDQMLPAVNSVREEFRKNFPFPIVIWITDDLHRKLVKLAPDFESWATTTTFAIAPEHLTQLLHDASDRLFATLLTPNTPTAFNSLFRSVDFGILQRTEIEAALRDLTTQNHPIAPDLQATLDFIRGFNATDNATALGYYQRSLEYWRGVGSQESGVRSQESGVESREWEGKEVERDAGFKGNAADENQPQAASINTPSPPQPTIHFPLHSALLYFYTGRMTDYLCKQEKHRQKNWGEPAREPLQQSVALFEQENRPDLAAKAITQLERVLQRLGRWDELEPIAQRGVALHQTYGMGDRLAQDYGFLADVALHREQWDVTIRYAQQALTVANQLPGTENHWYRSVCLLLMARAERQLGQTDNAIAHLLEAKSLDHQGHPRLYISILNHLRDRYLEQKQYLEAFRLKQERWSVEQQYGLRAFVGAGRLRPQRQEAEASQMADSQTIAQLQEQVAQEITASQRKLDLNRILERIGRNDCKLIVIHGYSGVGKSSLVNAGLIPALKQRAIGYRRNLPVVIRSYTNWVEELQEQLERELGGNGASGRGREEESERGGRSPTANTETADGNLETPPIQLKASSTNPEASSLDLERSSPNLEPSSTNLEPSSLNLEPSSQNPEASSLNLEPSSLNLEPSSPNLEALSLNLEPSSQNLEALSLNFEASPANLEASTPNHKDSPANLEPFSLNPGTSSPNAEASQSTPHTLLPLLHQSDPRNRRTILIFDQFEEFFFVYPDPLQRRAFFEFLGECLTVFSVKVILSLREDYIHYLLECNRLPEFDIIGNDILSKQVLCELGNFSPSDARAIIDDLTERSKFYLEPDLIATLVDDLAKPLGEVRPIELQVVGAQLQEDEIKTLAQYRALGDQPKQILVERYLECVVADCGTENQQIAELLLFLLTDEKGTRPLKTHTELEKEVQALLTNQPPINSSLDLVLRIFVDSGLVMLLPEVPEDRYQLVHDYLANFIRQQQEPKLTALMAELEQERRQRKLSESRLSQLEQAPQILDDALKAAKRRVPQKWNWTSWQPFVTALGVGSFIIALRLTGLFQLFEITTLDQLFRLRPLEPSDQRVVIVGIDDSDIQKVGAWSLSDETLAKLIEKIQAYQPRAIGLNLLRDLPVEPGHAKLRNLYATLPNLIGIEQIGSQSGGGVSGPPALKQRNQVGFSDLVLDSDGKVRRALLYAELKSGEQKESFALKLALTNLKAAQITPHPAASNSDYLQLGEAVFRQFKSDDGAYIRSDDGGYQILVNPRGPAGIPTMSMSDLMQGRVPPELIRDRVVLIGSTAPGLQDLWATPFGQLPGVEIQANITSQIISAALDGRHPVVQVWAESLEWLWIFATALVGAVIAWQFRVFKHLVWAIITAEISLLIVCYLAFVTLTLWIPLIPGMVSLLTAAVISALIASRQGFANQLRLGLELTVAAYREDPAAGRLAAKIFLLTTTEGKVAAQKLAEIVIDTLQQPQTIAEIATVNRKLAWMPSPPPESLSPALLQLIEISQQVENIDIAPTFSRQLDDSLAKPITALQALHSRLVNRKGQAKPVKEIAERWLSILANARL